MGSGETPTTRGMARSGYYDSHSEYQRAVAETGAALIERCVAATTAPDTGMDFVVADYGCSTGANSIAMVTRAVAAARKRSPQVPAVVIHNDVVTNDFNQLFANLVAAPDSYLRFDPPVLPLASAASFFGAAAPGGSVSLGMSFSAAHWLSAQPEVTVPEGFYFSEATGRARDVLAEQAASDWARFLRARSLELAPSGRLLVQMLGTSDQGDVTARKLMRAMAEVAAGMASDGILQGRAVEHYLLPVYARTATETARPLHDDNGLADAFGIDEIHVDPVPNPYLEQWRSDGDNAAYAKAYTAFVRGFTESSLRLHLFGGLGAAEDAAIDEYFARLERRSAADPEADRFEDWTLTVVLARRRPRLA